MISILISPVYLNLNPSLLILHKGMVKSIPHCIIMDLPSILQLTIGMVAFRVLPEYFWDPAPKLHCENFINTPYFT